ncbi:unnamed protein product [Rangifer tarandus platyrhynchus]|uniref:Uncharacterized protein n=2 Tax=Rangifer tarandus platyrhynchus TaxID=3082113 RepID=A0AC59ZVQ4_RANTA|nr:unnamed protein product [Rangifer tarandus platyrhynchus]
MSNTQASECTVKLASTRPRQDWASAGAVSAGDGPVPGAPEPSTLMSCQVALERLPRDGQSLQRLPLCWPGSPSITFILHPSPATSFTLPQQDQPSPARASSERAPGTDQGWAGARRPPSPAPQTPFPQDQRRLNPAHRLGG